MSSSNLELRVTADVIVPATDLAWHAVRASGPGGQNVNKVSTKVVLVFDLAASQALSEAAKARLRASFPSYVEKEGTLTIQCQETRDQRRNLEIARERLAKMIASALVVPKKRRKTRPSRGAKERRLAEKRGHAEKKARRRETGD